MEYIEKICFQGLKLQNKLLANMISTSFPGSFVFPPEREWVFLRQLPFGWEDEIYRERGWRVVCIRARDNAKKKIKTQMYSV